MFDGTEQQRSQLHDEKRMDLNADCVEFCNCTGHEDLVAVGTYELKEEIQKRIGELFLYQLQFSSDGRIQLKEAGSVRWTLCATRNVDMLCGLADTDTCVLEERLRDLRHSMEKKLSQHLRSHHRLGRCRWSC